MMQRVGQAMAGVRGGVLALALIAIGGASGMTLAQGSDDRTGESRSESPLAGEAAALAGAPQPGDLPDRFLIPEAWEWGSFAGRHGARLRYAHLPGPAQPRASIVIGPGFREFAEKYVETARDLRERGFDVWVLDWRGQGGSQPYLEDPEKPYAQGYDADARDLARFVDEVANPPGNRPTILLAHSMGGAIGLYALHDYPMLFDAAVLSAPMIRIADQGVPYFLMSWVAHLGNTFGFSKAYVPGAGAWEPLGEGEENPATRDPMRSRLQDAWYQARPEVRLGGATYGWLANAMAETAQLRRPAFLREIRTPVLVGVAGSDTIVDAEATRRMCGQLPRCQSVEYPEARHELLMEVDGVRGDFLERLERFVGDVTG